VLRWNVKTAPVRVNSSALGNLKVKCSRSLERPFLTPKHASKAKIEPCRDDYRKVINQLQRSDPPETELPRQSTSAHPTRPALRKGGSKACDVAHSGQAVKLSKSQTEASQRSAPERALTRLAAQERWLRTAQQAGTVECRARWIRACPQRRRTRSHREGRRRWLRERRRANTR
jgi:hypothetical protein